MQTVGVQAPLLKNFSFSFSTKKSGHRRGFSGQHRVTFFQMDRIKGDLVKMFVESYPGKYR